MTTTIPDTVVVSALTSSGAITGPLTGNVVGNVTGNVTGILTGSVVGNVTGNASGVALTQQVLSGDGAITLLSGCVTITKASAAAITLAAPTAGTDDGKVIFVFSETAFAHVITATTGFNRKGSSGTATASAAANNQLILVARNGQWNVQSNTGFTLA